MIDLGDHSRLEIWLDAKAILSLVALRNLEYPIYAFFGLKSGVTNLCVEALGAKGSDYFRVFSDELYLVFH